MSCYVSNFIRLLVTDLLGSLVWFPIWWYTLGLHKLNLAIYGALRYRWTSYSFNLWLKNFFVPMYGAYDIWSRLISVLMRVVVLSARLVAFGLEAAIYALGLLLWIIAPLAFAWLTVMSFLSSAT